MLGSEHVVVVVVVLNYRYPIVLVVLFLLEDMPQHGCLDFLNLGVLDHLGCPPSR